MLIFQFKRTQQEPMHEASCIICRLIAWQPTNKFKQTLKFSHPSLFNRNPFSFSRSLIFKSKASSHLHKKNDRANPVSNQLQIQTQKNYKYQNLSKSTINPFTMEKIFPNIIKFPPRASKIGLIRAIKEKRRERPSDGKTFFPSFLQVGTINFKRKLLSSMKFYFPS